MHKLLNLLQTLTLIFRLKDDIKGLQKDVDGLFKKANRVVKAESDIIKATNQSMITSEMLLIKAEERFDKAVTKAKSKQREAEERIATVNKAKVAAKALEEALR